MRLDYSVESERIRRTTLVATLGILLFCFIIIAARLWYLQVIKGEHYRKLSENNRIKSYRIPSPRGRILDSNGETLVDYAPSYDVYIDQTNMPEDPDLAERTINDAARICGVSIDRFQELMEGGQRGRPVRILVDASHEVLTAIEESRMKLEGVFPLEIDTVSKRVYLHVGLLSHFLGYCGEINKEMLAKEEFSDYRPGDLIGRTGIEQAFERYLHGKQGREWYEENARRTRLRLLNREPAVPGDSLTLTVDTKLQRTMMAAFNQAEGAVVAIDPKTGFILAAHSAPTFDAELFSRVTPPRLWQEMVDDPYRPLQNRVISGAYPPGSTYKLIMAAAGLQEGVVSSGTSIYCSGVFKLGKYPFRCWQRSGHGNKDLIGAIRESCDVYFYTLGQKLGIDRISRYSQAFGLGRKTGLGLIGEQEGLAPTQAWKKKRFDSRWLPGDTVSVSIGQGYNLVTPLQMAMAYSALVNGGKLMKPQIAKGIQNVSGLEVISFQPEVVGELPVDARHLEALRRGMVETVNQQGGTAKAARVPGVVIGGKTGTSQVVIQRGGPTLTVEETDYKKRDHAWFIGYGPAEDPRIVVAVIAEHSGHGGSVAAPVAQKILAAYLTPEPEVTTDLPAQGENDGL